ncbi:MAG: SPOR domain-containing protein [Candidatus Kapaibacterium sp.]
MAALEKNKLKFEESHSGFQPGEQDDDTFLLETKGEYPGKVREFEDLEEETLPNEVYAAAGITPKPAPEEVTAAAEESSNQEEDVQQEAPEDEVADEAEDANVANEAEDAEVIQEREFSELSGQEFGGSVKEKAEKDDTGTVEKEGLDEDEEYLAGGTAAIEKEKQESEQNALEEQESATPPETEINDETDAEVIPAESETADTDTGISDSEEEVAAKTQQEAETEQDAVSTGAEKAERTEAEEVAENIEKGDEETIELDDDLKNLLQDEINRGKKRVSIKTEEESEEKSDLPREDFTPVDDMEDARMYDLSDIEADKPSNYGKQAYLPEEEKKKAGSKSGFVLAGTPKGPAYSVENSESRKKEKKETEEKKKPLWVPIALVAAGIVLLALLGIGGYYAYNNFMAVEGDSEQIAEQEPTPPAEKESVNPGQEDIPEQREEAATNETDPDEELLAGETETAQAADDTGQSEAEETKQTAKVNVQDSEKELTERRTEQRQQVKQKRRSAPEKQQQASSPAETDKDRIYTVQVYASPSQEDAEEWLGKLKAKNLSGYISSQIIRDEVWYRVRFGKFETREEALKEARKLGFAQTWVDRVK